MVDSFGGTERVSSRLVVSPCLAQPGQFRSPRLRPLYLAVGQRTVRALHDEPLILGDSAVSRLLQRFDDRPRGAAGRPLDAGLEGCASVRSPWGGRRATNAGRGMRDSVVSCACLGSRPMLVRMPSVGSLKPSSGAPATMRSAPADRFGGCLGWWTVLAPRGRCRQRWPGRWRRCFPKAIRTPRRPSWHLPLPSMPLCGTLARSGPILPNPLTLTLRHSLYSGHAHRETGIQDRRRDAADAALLR